MKGDKIRKEDFSDDGRVIADMRIDGMPGSFFRRKSQAAQVSKDSAREEARIPKDERRAIICGIAVSYILFGAVFFGLIALLILFCTKVWFT